MDIIEYSKGYQEYKAELDAELSETAEKFVRIGYLLKVARDTNILQESKYDNVVDFAQAEYGIDKTKVSRFIRINDKFSEGGYSDRLTTKYQGFGYAKLTLMLSLPDAINEELTPNYSKTEIQAIKEEVDEEKKVSDIERILEGKDEKIAANDSELSKVLMQLGEDDAELFVEIHNKLKEKDWTLQELKEIMAPQEEKVYSVRIRGIGRMMLMLNTEADINVVNVRTGEKTTYNWEDAKESWLQMLNVEKTPQQNWAELYGREFPQKEPTQLEKQEEKTNKKPVQKKQTKVAKSAPQKKGTEEKKQEVAPVQQQKEESNKQKEPEQAAEEPTAENTIEKVEGEIVEEQIPGQAAIEDYPEYLPENVKSNYELWQEIKCQVKTRIDSLAKAVEEDNYAIVKWDAKKLAELTKVLR